MTQTTSLGIENELAVSQAYEAAKVAGKELKYTGIDNLSDFSAALSIAKIDKDEVSHLEVTPAFFEKLLRSTGPTPWIMYEGVKVYKDGTQEECDRVDGLTESQVRFPKGM